MIGPRAGVRVYLACGVTDMRKGISGLAALAQQVLQQNPASGAVFAFRGRRGDRIKLLTWDGQGFCLYYKVLERGHFPLRGLLAASISWIGSKASWPSMAVPCRRGCTADRGTAGDALGGDRLAPSGVDGTAVARGLNISPNQQDSPGTRWLWRVNSRHGDQPRCLA